MSLLDAFVIVSRPVVEVFSVGPEPKTIQSTVKPGVELVIKDDTFELDSHVNVEVSSMVTYFFFGLFKYLSK